jgi:hypothetical protein
VLDKEVPTLSISHIYSELRSCFCRSVASYLAVDISSVEVVPVEVRESQFYIWILALQPERM